MPRMVHHVVGLAAAAALCAPTARAQTWRTVDASRQRQSADSVLHVRVEYGAGEVSLAADSTPLLYDVRLRYDAERYAPTRHFDPAARTLTIGLDREGMSRLARARREFGVSDAERGNGTPNRLALGLAPNLPLDLMLNLGAVDADLDLSHLWLDRLVLRSGASDVKLAFGTANPRRLALLEILGGAASIRVSQLGNANAQHVRVRTGAASVDLDFSGAWAGDMTVDLATALGDATVRIPPNVGVRIVMRKLLGDLGSSDLHFTKRDGAYESDNWPDAPHKLTIDARTVLGDLTVRRTTP
ncbi:MAG TPA: LiaF domain-containing protein [Gemmatimonadaceae bacterium]